MRIYVEGLERSGNVYLSYAISLSTGIETFSRRDHLIETLVRYNGEYPFIVPVRDAIPSIASSKIYMKDVVLHDLYNVNGEKDSKIQRLLDRYEKYTDYLVENPQFFIAPFHEFTKDHNAVINKITKQYPYIKLKKKITREDIEELAFSQNSDVYHTERGNFPRETPKKAEAEEMLKSQYLTEMIKIQSNIDKLYDRYYAL